MDWKKRLNKKELMHLMDMGLFTLDKAMATFNKQNETRAENMAAGKTDMILEPCWTCKMIEDKLIQKGVLRREEGTKPL